jgi:formate hydrogenlyase subunit 3/multisubunit Na+/H+ antiporter MnhD subunit
MTGGPSLLQLGVAAAAYLVVALLSIPCAGYVVARLDEEKKWSEDEAVFLIKWSAIWPVLWLILGCVGFTMWAKPAAERAWAWLIQFAHRGFQRGGGE